MNDRDFTAWCKAATAKIRYGPDREAVSAELQAHLEDKYDALVASGLSPEEAAAKTLESMGSPAEIAPQLGAIHRPWLGYLYSTTRLIAITLCVVTVFALGFNMLQRFSSGFSYRAEVFDGYQNSEYYSRPNVTVYAEGYRFRITQAVVVPEEQSLYFQTETVFSPWMPGFTAGNYFWAVDSLGNHYVSNAEYDAVTPGIQRTGGMISAYGIQISNWWIPQFDMDAQWLELHYDRDGRNIVLRIELTGGEDRG